MNPISQVRIVFWDEEPSSTSQFEVVVERADGSSSVEGALYRDGLFKLLNTLVPEVEE